MTQNTLPDYFPSDWKFGTDGIRGPVEFKMNPLFIVKLGWSAGKILRKEGVKSVLIGKDTRISGYMIESALEAGFISSGMDVTLVGPIPTPGIAFLCRSTNQAGVVISASHNSFEDNGIKFFTNEGFKFSSDLELKIEKSLFENSKVVKPFDLGKATRLSDSQERYIEFCKSTCSELDLSGLSIVVDSANGANYSIAPQIFKDLGADVTSIFCSPDGVNINEGCGTTHPEILQKTVIEKNADLGIAFDGDGDRLVMVDNKGNVLDGDDLLYTLVSMNISKSKQEYKGIVGTYMTNKSLELYLNEQNIGFSRADVGDKYILNQLKEKNWILGGEPSGHIICLDSTTTGDALIASLKILNCLKEIDFDINQSLSNFKKFPQELISLKVDNPQSIIMDNLVRSEVAKLEHKLGKKGRILLRPSGTEDLIRVMVEADSKEKAESLANQLAEYIKKAA